MTRRPSATSGMEIGTAGRSSAVAMPPAPTAAMTPTPRTVLLRASPAALLGDPVPAADRSGWSPRWDSTPPTVRRPVVRITGALKGTSVIEVVGGRSFGGRPVGRHGGALLSFLLAYRVS